MYLHSAGAGKHTLRLEVSNCDGSPIADLATGFFSTSRFIIQELPSAQSPPLPTIALSPSTTISPPPAPSGNYQPLWRHCVAPNLDEFIDSGPLNGTECSFIKRDMDSIIKVTWDGNLRVLQCKWVINNILRILMIHLRIFLDLQRPDINSAKIEIQFIT